MHERAFLGEVRQDLLRSTEDKAETISSGNVEDVLRQARGKMYVATELLTMIVRVLEKQVSSIA